MSGNRTDQHIPPKEYHIKDSWIATLIAVNVAIGVNIAASHMSWDAVESLIGWSTLTFLVSALLLGIPARRFLLSIWIIVCGAWSICFRFTGDMGQAHFSGGFLVISLLVFTIVLIFRSFSRCRAKNG